MNLHRRHLDESGRSWVAAKLENMQQGRPGKDANLHDSAITRAKAAELLNVSTRSVASASKVQAEAAPEIHQAVESGAMSVAGVPICSYPAVTKEKGHRVRVACFVTNA